MEYATVWNNDFADFFMTMIPKNHSIPSII